MGCGEVSTGGFRIRVRGARGSLPVSGDAFRVYGGNTICLEMRCGDDVLIFDAGSGILPAGLDFKAEGRKRFCLFFTHCHYDHILGLPMFLPIYDRANSVAIWSGHLSGLMTTREMIGEFMRAPWFPVSAEICGETLSFHDFRAGDVLTPVTGVSISTGSLVHPGGAIGYRVDYGGKSVAVITDTEHTPGALDPEVLRLIEGVDLFFYDTTYTESEMDRHRGFGHSTWNQGILLAKAAGARSVGFLHHAPWRRDEDLKEIEAQASAQFPGAFCARDDQVIDL